jgi:acetoin utilization deacetylase AcuC-like enzyme
MSEPLYFRHPASLEHDTGGHPEGPGRIPAIERELEAHGWWGYRRVEAPEVDPGVLRRVHPDGYVEGIRRLAESGGGALDPDTVASRGSYDAAVRGAGGACALVEELVAGRARVGFSGMRPPGHHAEPARAMGFCLFNSIAVAARHALDSLEVERVLVLDWDVHHGNGTNDIFHDSRHVLFVSVHQSPLYPGTGPLEDAGSGEGRGWTVNLPVPPGSGEDVWLSMVEHVVVPVARAFGPELVLVSAGFDAHRDDPLASCRLEDGSFAALARWARALADEAGAPLGLVLEGGYDLGALARSVSATLRAVADDDGGAPPSVALHPLAERAGAHVGRYWTLG